MATSDSLPAVMTASSSKVGRLYHDKGQFGFGSCAADTGRKWALALWSDDEEVSSCGRLRQLAGCMTLSLKAHFTGIGVQPLSTSSVKGNMSVALVTCPFGGHGDLSLISGIVGPDPTCMSGARRLAVGDDDVLAGFGDTALPSL